LETLANLRRAGCICDARLVPADPDFAVDLLGGPAVYGFDVFHRLGCPFGHLAASWRREGDELVLVAYSQECRR
jgi:hypothetical protein